MKDVLLITPPFTQLNTPYPATVYLKGFLNTKGISSYQMDLGIEVIIELFSKKNISKLFELAEKNDSITSENARGIFTLRKDYLRVLDDVIQFLQGKKVTLAKQICTETFLPRASRFNQLNDIDWAYGEMGMHDKAKHLATLFLEDISDFIIECIDPNFGFSRYAERLGKSPATFDQLDLHLQKSPSFIDDLSLQLLSNKLIETQPKLVCFSVPFPGNLYSAFRCAQYIKKNHPEIKTAMGGGYPNTELRSLKEERVFDYFDFITLDDGEVPIEILVSTVLDPSDSNPHSNAYKRTFLIKDGLVTYNDSSLLNDYKQSELGTPDYSDLKLGEYISVIEMVNPMHSLWSDGRWNKLTMAHGCYWGKCTFCDISLDYISLYEPITATLLVDRMEEIIAQTGETGFHFVDEAAPPSLMKSLALEIIRRELVVTWWTNIRFEKNFTKDLCLLLKSSGCIAVSGGLEVASDRLLALIDKGVTVETVARTASNFRDSDIMVHAYLMYGYPSQTVQETIDSLEMVRQLFELGLINSAFWHQFALTAHSPIGLDPKTYNIVPITTPITFAHNDIDFTDSTGIDHDQFSFGLKKSLYNFMHGIGFDLPLQDWFDFKIPSTLIDHNHLESRLDETVSYEIKSSSRLLWLGATPKVEEVVKRKRDEVFESLNFKFQTKQSSFEFNLERAIGAWLNDLLSKIDIAQPPMKMGKVKEDFEKHHENFELFWYSKPIQKLRSNGLLTI